MTRGVVSESKVLGANFDSLDSLYSGPGPNLTSQLNLMNLKSAPRPGLELHVDPLDSSESEERASGGLNRMFWVPLSIH